MQTFSFVDLLQHPFWLHFVFYITWHHLSIYLYLYIYFLCLELLMMVQYEKFAYGPYYQVVLLIQGHLKSTELSSIEFYAVIREKVESITKTSGNGAFGTPCFNLVLTQKKSEITS